MSLQRIFRKFCNAFRMPARAAVLLLVSVLIAGASEAANDPPDADPLYAFAAHSYEQADYLTAAVEFKKFIFFYPDDPRTPKAAFKIGMAWYHQKRFPEAADAFETVTEKHSASGYATEAVFMLSRCHAKLNDTAAAFSRLQHLAQRTSKTRVRDRALYRIGWLHLKNGEPAAARAAFQAVSAENRQRYRIQKILNRLDNPEQLPRKSPLLAGLYAVFPGGGYLYTGRYRDALTAFVINAGLAVAAWESFDNDLPAIGGMISAVGLGFYSGSIYGAVNAAHKHNRRAYDAFVDSLEPRTDSHLSFHIEPRSQSLMISFQYRF